MNVPPRLVPPVPDAPATLALSDVVTIKDDERVAHAIEHPADAVQQRRRVHGHLAGCALDGAYAAIEERQQPTAPVACVVRERHVDGEWAGVAMEGEPRPPDAQAGANKGSALSGFAVCGVHGQRADVKGGGPRGQARRTWSSCTAAQTSARCEVAA
eukprot:103337-Prymnesium_polylepis.2